MEILNLIMVIYVFYTNKYEKIPRIVRLKIVVFFVKIFYNVNKNIQRGKGYAVVRGKNHKRW